MAAGEKLGYSQCTLCGYQVVIRENKRGLAYYSCEDCGCQHLARGPDSDRLMRGRITMPVAAAPGASSDDPAQAPEGGDDEFII